MEIIEAYMCSLLTTEYNLFPIALTRTLDIEPDEVATEGALTLIAVDVKETGGGGCEPIRTGLGALV